MASDPQLVVAHLTKSRPEDDFTPTTIGSRIVDDPDHKPTAVDTMSDEKSAHGNDQPVSPGQIPLRMRLLAFSFVLFFSTGAAFAESTIGPLKSTLRRELNINSELQICRECADHLDTQFSTVSTASNVVNTVLPLVGGIAMDYVGGV